MTRKLCTIVKPDFMFPLQISHLIKWGIWTYTLLSKAYSFNRIRCSCCSCSFITSLVEWRSNNTNCPINITGLVLKIRPGQSSPTKIRCECTRFIHTNDGLHNLCCTGWVSIRQVYVVEYFPFRNGRIQQLFFSTGMQNRFTPEQLGILASSALAYSIFELIIYSITLYITNIPTTLKTLDLLAYSGYKFAIIVTCILVMILFRKVGYYVTLIYCSLSLGFFLVKQRTRIDRRMKYFDFFFLLVAIVKS